MSGEPKTLTPEQEKAAREAFETRYKAFAWWTERFGTQHPALRKDENGDYLEGGQRKYWTGFQEGYAAALGVPVVARDEADELRAAVLDWWQARTDLDRAYPAWIRDLPEGESYAKYMAAAKEIGAKQQRVWDELREWARRLAGGESEK